MNYGIKTVVGGFGKPITDEELIPYTLARTYREHRTLRSLLSRHVTWAENAIEVGCGYGRNLPVLKEFSGRVVGIERDKQLAGLAHSLSQPADIYCGVVWDSDFSPDSFDLALTFTFLQHLNASEMERCLNSLQTIIRPHGTLILCEETDPLKNHEGCWSRTPEYYNKFLYHFKIEKVIERKIEPTFPFTHSGHFMVFKKFR